jgi:plasmid stabilization system protein ParE
VNRRASFHPRARLELLDASAYYASVGDGLGDYFLDEVSRATDLLLEHPDTGPIVRNDIRKKVLREFPYSLFYCVRGEEIRILAVAHHQRRPFYWDRRR